MDNGHFPSTERSLDRPQHDGEDTRLTSRKELSGWYSYGWAAEVGHRASLLGIVK